MTHLHQHLRRLYVEEEQKFLIASNRSAPGQLVTVRPSNCIQWAAAIWRRTSLHIRGSGGFKRVGAAVALDGSEDHLVTREAKQVWDEVDMKSAREEALCDVATELRAGRLQWTYNQVYDLVCEFPRRGPWTDWRSFRTTRTPLMTSPGVMACFAPILANSLAFSSVLFQTVTL